jgi:low temperature requirement protein LtrA
MHNDLTSMFANIHMTDFIAIFLSVGVLYAAGYAVMRVGSSALYMLKERRYLASEGAAFQGKTALVSSRLHTDFDRIKSESHVSV